MAPSKIITSPSLWNTNFDDKSYVYDHFNFPIDFPNDHKMASQLGATRMSNLVETHLQRGLMMENLMFNAHSQSYMSFVDLKIKLNIIRKTLAQFGVRLRLNFSLFQEDYFVRCLTTLLDYR